MQGQESPSLDRLRSIVQDSIGKHLYDNAIFFADKLVTLSDGHPDDVYRLAQAFYYTKQFRRAIHVLQRTKHASTSMRFRYIMAKCQAEVQEWDECLATLNSSKDDEPEEEDLSEDVQEGHINMESAVQLLKGRVHEAQENRSQAARCYMAALKADVYCFEALDHLVSNHMLSSTEEAALLQVLQPAFSPDEEWLRLYYTTKLNKHQEPQVAPQGGLAPLPELEGPMQKNADMLAAVAEFHYKHDQYQECYDITSRILKTDPFSHSCLPVHVCSLLQLAKKSELFYCAHQLVEEYPNNACAWFAVGCYYHLTGDHENARRYFSKATSIDMRFVPAWIGFGNAFAAQDESDQAMAAYRTSSRLFAGCHVPWLGIGMEYLRTNHLHLAEQYIRQAQQICPSDPLVLHELGVVHYQNSDYSEAAKCFLQVVEGCASYSIEMREPSLFNLGHAFRKMRDYPNAIKYYEMGLSVAPMHASTYSALGFTYHLQGALHTAIEFYHQSLGLKPDDTFTSEMLGKALEEVSAADAIPISTMDLGLGESSMDASQMDMVEV